jgi:phage replication O-like protein O
VGEKMPKGDRDVLKADIEDGYGKIANLLMEALIISKMNGVQKSICLFIIRRTYFWGIKYDQITLNEFAEACDSSKTYISTQLNLLIEKGVVLRKNYRPGKTPLYGINTRVTEWDKGFVNTKQLYEYITKGLYKCETLVLRKCERVHTDQPIETSIGLGEPKDIFKDSTTTITINDEQQEEKINQSFVADMDADSIQQKSDDAGAIPAEVDADSTINAVRKVEIHYGSKVLNRVHIGQKDLGSILEACKTYPLDFIIKCMDDTCERNRSQNDGELNITSFKYFLKVFKDEWKKEKLREAGQGIKPVTPQVDAAKGNIQGIRAVNRPIRQQRAAPNRFHNFQQRTIEYSDDELQSILRRQSQEKSQEYLKKVEEG